MAQAFTFADIAVGSRFKFLRTDKAVWVKTTAGLFRREDDRTPQPADLSRRVYPLQPRISPRPGTDEDGPAQPS
jgi:hypothetical protein